MKNARTAKPETAAAILQAVLTSEGLFTGISRHQVIRRWQEIVSPSVARHVKAERISGTTLFVAVDSSVWMNELAVMKRLLLDKVNATLPPHAAKFTDIKFLQRSWAASEQDCSAVKREPEVPAPTLEESRIRENALKIIRDEELRNLVKRVWEKDRALKWRRRIAALSSGETTEEPPLLS